MANGGVTVYQAALVLGFLVHATSASLASLRLDHRLMAAWLTAEARETQRKTRREPFTV